MNVWVDCNSNGLWFKEVVIISGLCIIWGLGMNILFFIVLLDFLFFVEFWGEFWEVSIMYEYCFCFDCSDY